MNQIEVMQVALASAEKCRNIAIASGAHEAYRAVGLAFNELEALLRQAIEQTEKQAAENKVLRDALSTLLDTICIQECGGEIDRKLAIKDAREALKGERS